MRSKASTALSLRRYRFTYLGLERDDRTDAATVLGSFSSNNGVGASCKSVVSTRVGVRKYNYTRIGDNSRAGSKNIS